MGDFDIHVSVLGPISTNCYFIVNTKTRETVVVDPGDRFRTVKRRIEEAEMRPVAVLLTHGHFDHFLAADAVRETYGVPVYAARAEMELMGEPSLSGGYRLKKPVSIQADKWLEGGDVIRLAGLEIKVMATPGHTAGSVCYYIESEKLLLSGDTLFCGGVGRTDFPTGSAEELERSIKERIFALPEETAVYPGHGESTTVGREKGVY